MIFPSLLNLIEHDELQYTLIRYVFSYLSLFTEVRGMLNWIYATVLNEMYNNIRVQHLRVM